MRNRTRKAKARWILVVGLIALLLMTACAPGEPKEKENVAEIGLFIGLTGAAASAESYAFRFMDDYIRYFNAEKGIPGVTVKLVWRDTGLELPKSISVYREYIAREVPILILFHTTETETLRPWMERDRVPGLTYAPTEAGIYPPGWVYTVWPTESERFSILCDWIIGNWKEARPPKIAVIGGDTGYGRAVEVMGYDYAESVGIEMLPMEIVPYVPLDTSTQLLRVRERQADYVYISSFATTALPILRDAQRLELFGKMQFSGYETSQCEALLKELGPAAEGYLAARTGPWGREDIEGLKLCHSLQMKYHGNVISQGDEAVNIRLISTECEALRRAIENVGYENLNGAAVKEALDSIKDFDPLGVGPTTYTPEDHEGSHRIRIYQVQNGEVVPVSDWREAPMLVPGK